uniref:Uncharacterized protein n=1 Tax=Poecilia latipinna TaxID=48699 RepID=A0A3B3VHP0_9TELE
MQVEDPALEQKLFLSSSHGQTESGTPILLQLLEFKTGLQDVIEELHIRRVMYGVVNSLVSGTKSWPLEGILPCRALVFIADFDTHNNNITFQGKYQVSAELKDKEINNLKEELKSLQLLKYNLEKKSSELVRRDPPFIQSVDR